MTTPEDSLDEALAGISGVVVGDDGSRRALDALVFAFEEASRRQCPLHVLRCWTIRSAVRPEGMPSNVVPSIAEFQEATHAALQRRVESVRRDWDVDVTAHTIRGNPIRTLLAASRLADVVVVGDRGVTGIAGRFIGSTATQVVRDAECTVIVVKRREDVEQ